VLDEAKDIFSLVEKSDASTAQTGINSIQEVLAKFGLSEYLASQSHFCAHKKDIDTIAIIALKPFSKNPKSNISKLR
jgi:hypothetical protein